MKFPRAFLNERLLAFRQVSRLHLDLLQVPWHFLLVDFVLYIAFGSSDFVCFNHLSRELGLVLTNGLPVFCIPVGTRL